MRPVPIADDLVWEGAHRIVVGPPNNDLESPIAPVEACVAGDELGPYFAMRILLEPGDRERLEADPHFWLIIRAPQLPAFALVVPETA